MLSRRLQWPLVARVADPVHRAARAGDLRQAAGVVADRAAAGAGAVRAPLRRPAPTNRYAILDEPAFVAAGEAKHRARRGLRRRRDVQRSARTPIRTPRSFTTPVDRAVGPRQADAADVVARTRTARRRWRSSRDLQGARPRHRLDPADALLLYNSRTRSVHRRPDRRRRTDGAKPAGVDAHLRRRRTTWRQWRAAHPETRVLRRRGDASGADAAASRRVTEIRTRRRRRSSHRRRRQPRRSKAITSRATPINVKVGDTPVVMFRDPATGARESVRPPRSSTT